ncbi:M23 family metallopeptidase [Marivirga sp. S37H4]|uniref:M23 family metallopeptidase n=1 Tax=Marivirga aurantiaca TaxID=2802615 RepID=A0A935CB55_9BACT|nr:M23 family metallopeptidase [Marivirga aurantiaca]MBK6266592.1 M23 family metallopeptidase [Marivirga aurantiaca]
MINFRNTILLLFLSCLIASCKIDQVFAPKGPYEKYLASLKANDLEQTALAQDWITAGESALKDSTYANLPYAELSRFDPAEPTALFLRYKVKEGQNIEIHLKRISESNTRIFVNVFEWRDEEFKPLGQEADGDSLTYKVENSGEHAVRIQPELLRGGLFQIYIRYTASLAFPLPERTYENIGSFYGDGREAGRRKHEGIDIFSPRGTPVLAVRPGFIRRVGVNNLGGKVIFLSGGGYSYYYAHLDSQMVHTGQRVVTGDTLGLVGNTGNAITTSPHLHFGIYSMGSGALDPFPFFATTPITNIIPLGDSASLGKYHRVNSQIVNLRSEANTQSEILGKLNKNELVRVEASLLGWYRVKLPDDRAAFIHQNLVKEVGSGLQIISLKADDQIKDEFLSSRTYSASFVEETAKVLGSYQDYLAIRFSGGTIAWLRNTDKKL